MALRSNTIKRYAKIQARYNELHEVQKLRYDYTLELLCKEFYLEEGSLQRALRTELPTVLPPKDANQLSIFGQATAEQ